MEIDLNAMIDALPGLAWTAFPSRLGDYFGVRWRAYTGLSVGEAAGEGWLRAVHPEDIPHLFEVWTTAVGFGHTCDVEARLLRHDGIHRWFNLSLSPVTDVSGTIIRWCGVNTDIEDRKRAEEALRASERNLKQIINTLPTTAWATDPQGYAEFLSDRWLEYTGIAPDQALGLGWTEALHPDDAAALLAYWQSCLEAGEPANFEARMRRHDGEYRWFLFRDNPLRDANGTIVKWYGASVDIEDRKRAEEALRASERNLKQIINTLPTTAWVTDPNGYVEFLSDRWLNYAGITAEQGAGFGWGTVIHPEDAPALFAYWHSCLEAGTPVDTEARMRRFDGEYRWFLFRASPMRDEQGAILKWYGTNIDIEDRKRADEALLASEHNLALIINTIPIAAWSARADGFTDFLNETYLNYAGDTSTQIEGWGWRDLVHPDDVNSLDAYWRSCIETGAPGSAEARMRRYDGVYHWFLLLANALRDKSGAVIKWYGATIDIEDRKRAESLLAGEKQLLAMVAQGQLLDDVLNALCQIVERNSRSSLCSILSIEQADSRFRYGAGPSLPSVVRVALDGLIIDRAHSPCGLAAESKTQVVAADLETDPRWQASPWPKLLVGHGLRACWSTPILSSEERVIGMFTLYQREPATPTAIDEDLIRQFAHVASIAIERSQSDAELRRTDEALSRTRSELTQMARVTTLGALTASIAHEVNQPLAGVVTNSSICLRMLGADPPDVEGALESTRRTIRDGNLASEVIRRLRELFARNQPKMEPVDLNDAAREVLTLSLSELQDRRIVVHTDFADDLPVVSADRIQLQQVILNLVRNAADAMSELDNRPRDLTVSTAAEEGLVSLFVRDVGPGIEPMHLQRLFDAFYTTKADGMGVGLSISQSIIDGHEGRLWTVPNDGPGVTFAFSIPSRRALVNGSPPLDCAGSHPRG